MISIARKTVGVALLVALLCSTAMAGVGKAQTGSIKVIVEGMEPGKPIAAAQALCTLTAEGKSDKVELPTRPTIRWSGVPKGTASLAVFMMDPDVPSDFTNAGKDGKILPAEMKRMDFFHYAVVNLPSDTVALAGGPSDKAPAVGQELFNDLGANGYVNPKTAFGGPCPPWNDERLHHYHFIVLALDKDAPALEATPRGEGVNSPNTAKHAFDRLMTSSHVLAKGTVIGTYTLNKGLRSSAAATK